MTLYWMQKSIVPCNCFCHCWFQHCFSWWSQPGPGRAERRWRWRRPGSCRWRRDTRGSFWGPCWPPRTCRGCRSSPSDVAWCRQTWQGGRVLLKPVPRQTLPRLSAPAVEPQPPSLSETTFCARLHLVKQYIVISLGPYREFFYS